MTFRSPEPTCLGVNYSNTFFSPDFGTVVLSLKISAGQNVQVSWYGGKGDGTVQVASLWLACNRQKGIAIVDSGSFIFGNSPSSNWTYLDDCGNTKLSYNWTVPAYADIVSACAIMSDVQFSFMASSQNDSFARPPNSTSPSFVILQEAASTSTTPTSSPPPIISTTILHTSTILPDTTTTASLATSTSPLILSNSTSLSAGAKAGIGIGCVAFAVFVALGVFIYMKRVRTKRELSNQQREKFEKPELSSEVAPNRAVEIEGAEIHEMDRQAKERPPSELPSG